MIEALKTVRNRKAPECDEISTLLKCEGEALEQQLTILLNNVIEAGNLKPA